MGHGTQSPTSSPGESSRSHIELATCYSVLMAGRLTQRARWVKYARLDVVAYTLQITNLLGTTRILGSVQQAADFWTWWATTIENPEMQHGTAGYRGDAMKQVRRHVES